MFRGDSTDGATQWESEVASCLLDVHTSPWVWQRQVSLGLDTQWLPHPAAPGSGLALSWQLAHHVMDAWPSVSSWPGRGAQKYFPAGAWAAHFLKEFFNFRWHDPGEDPGWHLISFTANLHGVWLEQYPSKREGTTATGPQRPNLPRQLRVVPLFQAGTLGQRAAGLGISQVSGRPGVMEGIQ